MSPARDDLTPIGRTDSATTFDSPFSAVLLAVWGWESLFLPASGQGGRFLMAFQGILCFIPPVLRAGAVPRRPLPVFFWPGIFCTQNFVCKAWAESPPMGGDLSAGRRVLVPHACRRWRMQHPSPPRPANQTTGATAARRRGRAHTARQAERARQRREDDRRDSGDGRARAPRATDFGQRPKDAGGCAPAPAKISGRVRPPKGEARRGEGGSAPWARRGKGNDPTRNRAQRPAPPPDQTPEQPPTTAPGGAPRARNRTGSRTTARRGDAKQSAASGQAAQADAGKDGQRAREPPNTAPRPRRNATTPADGETAARRTATAQAGRKQDARVRPPPQGRQRRKTPEQNATARARPTRRPRTTAATGGSTHARRAGAPCANAQTASEQRAQRANARKAGGRAKARTRPPREAAGAAARPPPSQTPRAARTQRAARPIVARRCGHFRAGGMREILPSAFSLPSLVRFRGMGGVIAPQTQKIAQKGEKTRIWD